MSLSVVYQVTHFSRSQTVHVFHLVAGLNCGTDIINRSVILKCGNPFSTLTLPIRLFTRSKEVIMTHNCDSYYMSHHLKLIFSYRFHA